MLLGVVKCDLPVCDPVQFDVPGDLALGPLKHVHLDVSRHLCEVLWPMFLDQSLTDLLLVHLKSTHGGSYFTLGGGLDLGEHFSQVCLGLYSFLLI